MNDADKMEAEAYKARRCIFELHGKRVNPYHIIESREYSECLEAVYRLTPQIGNNMNRIQDWRNLLHPIFFQNNSPITVITICISNQCIHYEHIPEVFFYS